MHEFLEDGLRTLFDGKKGTLELVVANYDHHDKERTRSKNWVKDDKAAGPKTRRLIQLCCPNGLEMKLTDGGLALDNFWQFITREMAPVEIP
jgi:hypothetical protein